MPQKKKEREEVTKPIAEKHKHEEVKIAPCPKRIRINFSGGNQHRTFSPGDKLRVPEDVPEDSARSWLAAGKAFEDKSGEGPAETK